MSTRQLSKKKSQVYYKKMSSPGRGNFVKRASKAYKQLKERVPWKKFLRTFGKKYRKSDYVLSIRTPLYKLKFNGNNPKFDLTNDTITLKYKTRPTQHTMISDIRNELRSLNSRDGYNIYLHNNSFYYGEEKGIYNDIKEIKLLTFMKQIKYSLTQMDGSTVLSEIKNFEFEPLIDPTIGSNLIFGDERLGKMCGISCLLHFIQTSHKNIRKYDEMTLIYQMSHIKGYNEDNKYEYIKENGISINDLYNWVIKYGNNYISLYIVGPDNELIMKYLPEDNKGGSALVLKMNNNHFYYIIDDVVRDKVFSLNKITQKKMVSSSIELNKNNSLVIENSDDINNIIENMIDEQIYLIIKENWQKVISNYTNQSGTMIKQFDSVEQQISNFTVEQKKENGMTKIIMIRPDYDSVNEALEDIRNYETELTINKDLFKYRGQSMSSIHSDLMSMITGVIPQSKYNKGVFDTIREFQRPPLVENYDIPNSNTKKECYGIDISKADTQSRLNIRGNIPLIHHNCKIEPYNGEEMQEGLYFVSDSFFGFQKYNHNSVLIPQGFYPKFFIEYFLSKGIIPKDMITHKILSISHLKGDILKPLTEIIFDIFDKKPHIAKEISNCGTGMFGKLYKKSLTGFFTNSLDTAVASYNEKKYISQALDNNLFFCKKGKREIMYSNNNTIYNSIIAESILNLVDMMDTYINEKSELHGIRRDCIYGRNFNHIIIKTPHNKLIDSVGTVKLEKYNPPKSSLRVRSEIEPNFDINREFKQIDYLSIIGKGIFKFIGNVIDVVINKLLLLSGCLIIGGAGHGKTYTMNKMVKKVGEDDCLILAPYNKHVCNLRSAGMEKAKTIKSSLYLRKDGYNVQKYKGGKKFPYKYVFVDEAFVMTDMDSWTLYNIWLENPEVIFYFFGDPNQCQGIEICDDDDSMGVNIDYINSISWVHMLKNKIELPYVKESARYDDKLHEEALKILRLEQPNLQIYDKKKHKNINRFITYTNKTCDLLNEQVMKKLSSGDVFDIPKEKYGSQSKLDYMRLIKGSPVSAYSNRKGLWYNNEEFTYIGKFPSKDGQEMIQLKNCCGVIIEIICDVFKKNFIVSYAMTTDRAQSITFDFPYVVMEIEKLNRNRLYTAITRARAYNNVYIDKPIKKIYPIEYKYGVEYKIKNTLYKTGYIYKISHIDTKIKKYYIGSTAETPEQRFYMHKKNPSGGMKTPLEQYGVESFKLEQLEKVLYKKKSELLIREFAHIKQAPAELLYNIHMKNPTSKTRLINKMFGKIEKIKGISLSEKYKMYKVKNKTFRWNKPERQGIAYKKALCYLYSFINV